MTTTPKHINFRKISRLLHIKGYGIDQIPGVTKKMVHSWRALGLIDESREKSIAGVTQYFDSLEVLWLSLIVEMRNYGIATQKIKACREGIFHKMKAEDGKYYSAFECYVLYILVYDIPIYVVLANNTEFLLLDDTALFDKMRLTQLHSGAFFLLNDQIKKALPFLFDKPNYSALSTLNDKEVIALQVIRSKAYKSIKITKKNGEITMVEGVERIEKIKKITSLLKQGKYQNIEIKQSNGKIVCAHKTVRKKF